ncbi:calmodulin-binding protein 60 A-like isoform X1 [Capsicum galapagoense]
MAQNIVFEEGNKSTNHTETRNSTISPFTRAIRDVVSLCKLRRIVIAFLLALFPFPVEDEFRFRLERILTARDRKSQKKIHPCESGCLLLKFSGEVAPVVFTGECIFPKGTKLELADAVTGQKVRHGPPASAQVEIFLLNGDESWTIKELNSHIMMQKRGGKSGRCKNPYLRLEGGVVSVNEIKFKHTPKHMKKLKVVRLGARIVDQPVEIKVIEAVTGPFTVKDKRLKSKKRYPPSPTDDVWRLDQIYRSGAFHDRLTENGIRTVEDFLIELQNNSKRLRHILGESMSRNSWNTVTNHAKTCNLDGRKYLYCHLETEQNFSVVFNAAGQVISLDSGCGLHYFNVLSESQKAYAHKLVEIAFANWVNVRKFDNDVLLMDHLSSSKFSPSSCHTVDDFQQPDQRQFTSMSNFVQRTAESNRCVISAECSTSYAVVGQHAESDWISLDIPVPGHPITPNQITSANSDSAYWEQIMQLLSSDELQFEDFPFREPDQANYSAAETSATRFHDEAMDLSQNQLTHLMNSENVQSIIMEDGTNDDQWRQSKKVSLVPVASMCKGKSKKSWAKISSIIKWFLLKRFVKLKKVRITKKRKLIS